MRRSALKLRSPVPRGSKRSLLSRIGPGLITGASDDDPSGIATYSQVGSQFGLGMLWTMVFSYPLMAGIQEISARVGRVTGHGLADSLRKRYFAACIIQDDSNASTNYDSLWLWRWRTRPCRWG